MNAPTDLPGRALPATLPRGLQRDRANTLGEQLAARFADRIATRALPPGARLPSVRECARQQGVSPSTVVAAYDQLQAQGLVEAQRQRGFFVREAAAPRGATPAPLRPPTLPAPIDATALIRGMFQGRRGRDERAGHHRPHAAAAR
jgi:DNA-binding transcriptional MocR family regulator